MKTDATLSFRRVLRYCERWGVDVEVGDFPVLPGAQISRTGWSGSAFSLGGILSTRRGRRIVWDESGNGDAEACELLHELGHCLDRRLPWNADEIYGPMLAFEYFSTRFLHLKGRSEWMVYFGLGDEFGDAEWDAVSTRTRGDLLRRSLKRAIDRGLLTKTGKPTFQNPRARVVA